MAGGDGTGMAGCIGGGVVLGGCAVALLAALVGGVVALGLFAAVNPIITTTVLVLLAAGGFRAWQLRRRHRNDADRNEPPAER